jgi:hypothetical protein
VISTIGAAVKIAALLIRMSIWPKRGDGLGDALSMLSCRVTSISHGNGGVADLGRGARARCDVDVGDGHPGAFGNIGLGKGRPIPRARPVIRADLPSRRFMQIRSPCASNLCR